MFHGKAERRTSDALLKRTREVFIEDRVQVRVIQHWTCNHLPHFKFTEHKPMFLSLLDVCSQNDLLEKIDARIELERTSVR